MGTVAEYRREFEFMSASMVGLPDEVLEVTFVKGLKLEIRVEVREAHWTGPINGDGQTCGGKNLAIKAISDQLGSKIK